MTTTDDIRWQSFERSALPKALFGRAVGGARGEYMRNALEAGRGVVLGYLREEEERSYSPPVLILIEDKTTAETLSWLKTYAPETSPLSQFARVVTRSDWEQYGEGRSLRSGDMAREDLWACVVLGELLAQHDTDFELSALPLSWSMSCFSTAVARSTIIHSGEGATRTCVERLLVLEKDQRFARRSVGAANLQPIWLAAATHGKAAIDAPGVVELILSAIRRTADGPTTSKTRLTLMVGALSDFSSDSVENRVIAFQRLVTQVTEETGESIPTTLAQAVVAAGAFLVGRGSSHGFLLARLPRRWSHAFLWFGLMAGIAGPQSWDPNWSRAAKGVERFLRGRFDWCSAPAADLSWPEYLWLASTFTGNQVFVELPKIAAKVLTVEVLPGANCQLRLAADAGGSAREVRRGERLETASRDRQLRDVLEHLADLAIRARHLVGEDTSHFRDQASLEFGEEEEPESSGPRSRSGRRKLT